MPWVHLRAPPPPGDWLQWNSAPQWTVQEKVEWLQVAVYFLHHSTALGLEWRAHPCAVGWAVHAHLHALLLLLLVPNLPVRALVRPPAHLQAQFLQRLPGSPPWCLGAWDLWGTGGRPWQLPVQQPWLAAPEAVFSAGCVQQRHPSCAVAPAPWEPGRR